MDARDAKDPATMSEDELRAEVWYWREEVASRLHTAVEERNLTWISLWTVLLDGAVDQSAITKCFACNEVLVPGQPAIRDVSEGDAHAGCMGQHIDGDRYQLDPEGICGPDDEPIPGHDGVLTSHPYAPLRTTAQMATLLTQAWSMLGEPADAADAALEQVS